jgi:hypothetical protein
MDVRMPRRAMIVDVVLYIYTLTIYLCTSLPLPGVLHWSTSLLLPASMLFDGEIVGVQTYILYMRGYVSTYASSLINHSSATRGIVIIIIISSPYHEKDRTRYTAAPHPNG